MTDESGQTYPFTVDALLDRAIGPEGYYGAFVDKHAHGCCCPRRIRGDHLVGALARGVPVVSARQMLTWLDGRNASTFRQLTWTGDTLTFSISVGPGAQGLRAMLPVNSTIGNLMALTRAGSPVPYTVQTIKGVAYAFFTAEAGDYAAQYSDDSSAPVISALSATSGQTTATVTWQTNEPASSRVEFGLSPGSLGSFATVGGESVSHAVQLTGLTPGTTYYYRAVSSDSYGNVATSPTTPAAFTTTVPPPPPPLSLTDTLVADFAAGTLDAGTYITESANGEVTLRPSAGAEFSGSALPAGWSSFIWNAGGSATVAAGTLSVDGARVNTDAMFGPGQTLEFVATFGTERFRHVGFGITLDDGPWAMFSTGSGGALLARTLTGGSPTDTPISGNWLNAPHLYRIDWTTSAIVYSIDGAVVATHGVTITANMRPVVSDFDAGAGGLVVDWIRMTPYSTAGTFLSRVLDSGASTTWGNVSWTALNAAAGLAVSVRFGDTPTPDASWSAFVPVGSSGAFVPATSRYVQYQMTLTGNGTETPIVQDVTISAQLDSPLPLISVGDVSVMEGDSGNATAVFTLLLSRPDANQVSVSYATTDGTAQSPMDYLGRSDTVIFAPGSTTAVVAVPVVGDLDAEPDETFALNLMLPANGVLLDSQGVAAIRNDDLPAISIADVSLYEGNTGARSALFRLSLSGPATQTISAQYSTGGGSATSGGDYTARSGSVTFGAGVMQATVAVPVLGDVAREFDETFNVTLSAPVNATLARTQATATILNDDPVVQMSIADVVVTEGNAGVTNAVFTVSLNGPSTGPVTASFTTSNGTAAAGSDYTTTAGQVSLATGTTTTTITVPVTGDFVDEANETFLVTLSGISGDAVISDAQATGTITDNDETAINIADATILEGNSGSANVLVAVTLSVPSVQTVTVNYATADGTAVAPADYTTRSGTLSFAPGVTTAQISVPVAGDTRDEVNETFTVTLSGAANATLADSVGVVTITDNDATPSLAMADVTRAEGNSGTANAVFTVTLSAASAQTVTVDYATADGTAQTPSDYTATAGTLTLRPARPRPNPRSRRRRYAG